MNSRRVTAALAAVLAVGLLTGCASVPSSSSVQVLGKVSEAEGRVLPSGPADNVNPLDLVRGFVYASGSSENRHAVARRFLTADAASWDDSASVTVLAEQFDTVYAVAPAGTDTATVRLRGNRIGRLTTSGAFEPDVSPVQIDLQVAKENGQWRISGLPGGAMVRLSDFQVSYDAANTYFVDPVRRAPAADRRYLPSSPARSKPSRMIEMLLAGPSAALAGAAVSMVPPTARLRSNVTDTAEGGAVVDLTGLGELDDSGRRLLAAQVVLSLAEVNVTRVRLLADGAPLLTDRPDRPDLVATDVPSLTGQVEPRFDVPGAIVLEGRLRSLAPSGSEVGNPVPGPAGSGGVDIATAALSADGQRLAVVSRQGQLLVGRLGAALDATAVPVGHMTRPSWAPGGTEVWTVLNGTAGARVVVDQEGRTRTAPLALDELTALGPIADLRLSRDGVRVAAVVAGQLAVGAVVRSPTGEVAVRNVRVLRAAEVNNLAAVDWKAADTIAVAAGSAERPVSLVSVDGLNVQQMPGSNLTPPLLSIAAGPSRPLLVTDQGGVWSFTGGELDTWRQVVGGVPSAVPVYPG